MLRHLAAMGMFPCLLEDLAKPFATRNLEDFPRTLHVIFCRCCAKPHQGRRGELRIRARRHMPLERCLTHSLRRSERRALRGLCRMLSRLLESLVFLHMSVPRFCPTRLAVWSRQNQRKLARVLSPPSCLVRRATERHWGSLCEFLVVLPVPRAAGDDAFFCNLLIIVFSTQNNNNKEQSLPCCPSFVFQSLPPRLAANVRS